MIIKSMKNFNRVICISLIIALSLLTACDEGLDQQPLSSLTASNYFNTANSLKLYTNQFYQIFRELPIANGNSLINSNGVYDTINDDVITGSISRRVRGDRVVPQSEGGWDWSSLRNINYFLTHYQTVDDEQAKKNYSGIAYFFRAYFYFQKVRRFGDVPWYSKPIDPTDKDALQKKRDPRSLVIDSVMADLNYAIENISSNKNVYRVTKWTALALKARVGLFEGTFRKYHKLGKYKKYLSDAVQAAKQLMDSGTYQLYSTGKPNSDYQNLFFAHDAKSSEIILARQYSAAQQVQHNVNHFIVNSCCHSPGMPKDLVNSYLMKDGSRFTNKKNYNSIPFAKEVANRDPRLGQTIRTPGYHRIGQNKILPPNFSESITGYELTKFLIEPEFDGYLKNINDLPLFRYAEVLLNYAEAKGELGTLIQNDLDQSINILRDRVDMPHLMLTSANANPDPFLEHQYPHVEKRKNEGVILEIRRERRIELYMEGFRWDDLMRWKEGQKLTQSFRGMYFPGPGKYDLDQDGQTDTIIYQTSPPSNQKNIVNYLKVDKLDKNGLIIPNPQVRANDRAFNEGKDYLYPITRNQLLLNPNLKQNPGWGK